MGARACRHRESCMIVSHGSVFLGTTSADRGITNVARQACAADMNFVALSHVVLTCRTCHERHGSGSHRPFRRPAGKVMATCEDQPLAHTHTSQLIDSQIRAHCIQRGDGGQRMWVHTTKGTLHQEDLLTRRSESI